MTDITQFLLQLSVVALPVLVAITFHEAAHGYAALRLGDATAYRLGRVSFNPLRHVDPLGTVILPLAMFFTTGFLFGWAKPVPVDFRNLNNPRRDMVWVALAGPGINIVLAVVSALLLHVTPLLPELVGPWMVENLQVSIFINVVLAVFNMLPLPPLDGGRVAVGLLPDPLARPLARVEPFGIFLVMGVLFLLPFIAGQLGLSFNPFRDVILPPVNAIVDGILRLTGLL